MSSLIQHLRYYSSGSHSDIQPVNQQTQVENIVLLEMPRPANFPVELLILGVWLQSLRDTRNVRPRAMTHQHHLRHHPFLLVHARRRCHQIFQLFSIFVCIE